MILPKAAVAAVFCAGLIFSAPQQSPKKAPPAQAAWQTATQLNGVDFSGLSPSQKTAALKMLRERDCTCGCNMKVAECRMADPQCSYSGRLAAMIVQGFREGKTPQEVAKVVDSSAIGHPKPPPKTLEDEAYTIPTDGEPSLGPANARLTLVEFSDFECPYCAEAAANMKEILHTYGNQIRLVYKQFPLDSHPHARMAAAASLAAAEQGKFWELHDKMFANFRRLNRESIIAWAKQLGMDERRFTAAMDSANNRMVVEKDLAEGDRVGVEGTPTFFINGHHYNGPVTLAALKPILDQQLKTANARASR